MSRAKYDKKEISRVIEETNNITLAAKKMNIPRARLYQYVRANARIIIEKKITINWHDEL